MLSMTRTSCRFGTLSDQIRTFRPNNGPYRASMKPIGDPANLYPPEPGLRNVQSSPSEQSVSPTAWKIGPASAVLIGISVIVAVIARLGDNLEAIRFLFITEDIESVNGLPFPEIMHGQVWRLLTPIFIHFGLVHLLFNMMWLKDLGTAIEQRLGVRTLLALVVATGVLSNLGQCIFDGPLFGGMSGVVYGLFGFIWMMAHFDPASGFRMPKNTVILMVGWFFLCITGAIGPVGNFSHGVGLGVGVLWGFIAARRATVVPA